MSHFSLSDDLARKPRLAGMFYLVIIVMGLGAELGLRGPLIDLPDATGTAEVILAAPGPCWTNRVEDSLRESSMIAGVHEQLGPYEVQDHELVGVQ